ncbi:phage minor tail protein L [Xanthomonas campestris pv. trichodesmae]|uniref:Phage minor tail protein L n=2 Tax=Xanthomonas citri TaxID=346 RepID=A0AB33CQU2_XANCI|nr:phage minor tail protein L [Xanthomonas citri]ASK92623.1 phage minor tail protein L [Xanthomonas citri pv. vignicola]MBV6782068.1 phage minor tail protein L [Xanthomonas campestris pv. trichodesmae]MBZ3920442.1 phage tail protein [Xanthomonas campestris pv. trichodesmae]MBZ3923789.1 phage tail protein [Xanthomonas citri pv. sesbaniae]
MSLLADIQTLEPGARVTLFELDATSLGADSLLFHAHLQTNPIVWQGQVYDPWPVEATGFERTSDQPPNPRLRVGNIDGTITALCLLFDDLVGARLIRRQTLAKYLDPVNFAGGNPTADPEEHFPDEIWFIERKVSEDHTQVEFELATAADLNGEQLPGRQIIANTCSWIIRGGYRGPYCGYNGPPVADINDNPVSEPSLDVCGGKVRSCKLRFGANNPLPYGGFPAAGLLRT